ncbi:hypothetical protein [Aquimarina mytili]|uniref:Uncharacterized protein n=1 Tax=Aquimarina mytili TaxID=874423 RepID=A0A937A0N2_9FLAO|nr:hypothetical protein [Aquimarina mytili]MBL0685335.1 hypothetical protein [Aquimarina mytili]
MEAYLQQQKHHYFATILQALHFKMDAFIYNLVHHSPYETLLYRWMVKLYKKGKTSEEALQLIYKARNIILLTPTTGLYSYPICTSKPQRNISNPNKPSTNK